MATRAPPCEASTDNVCEAAPQRSHDTNSHHTRKRRDRHQPNFSQSATQSSRAQRARRATTPTRAENKAAARRKQKVHSRTRARGSAETDPKRTRDTTLLCDSWIYPGGDYQQSTNNNHATRNAMSSTAQHCNLHCPAPHHKTRTPLHRVPDSRGHGHMGKAPDMAHTCSTGVWVSLDARGMHTFPSCSTCCNGTGGGKTCWLRMGPTRTPKLAYTAMASKPWLYHASRPSEAKKRTFSVTRPSNYQRGWPLVSTRITSSEAKTDKPVEAPFASEPKANQTEFMFQVNWSMRSNIAALLILRGRGRTRVELRPTPDVHCSINVRRRLA